MGEWLYERAIGLAPAALRVAAPFSPKLAQGLEGRRLAVARLETWARDQIRRDHAPVVWLHAPSVGEALMAQAILGALRRRRPELRAVFTFFSPSAERVAERVGADIATYLPWDTADDMGRALALLEPAAIVFVRTEIWPVLVRLAAGQGISTILANAVLAPGSSRLRAHARALLREAYVRLDAVGAVSADDAQRFTRLGAQRGRVHVTGDARFDQVEARIAALDRDSPAVRAVRNEGRLTVVAGSTWPQDEERLVPAFVRLRAAAAGARLVVAPHEPTPEHLDGLERRLAGAGLPHVRLGAVEHGAPATGVIVVDRVGVLADLYATADIAWIGGGFGRHGLHSVAEPAVLGVPVVCGPRHGNAREAASLAAAGGAFIVTDTDAAAARLVLLGTDDDARAAAARSARAFVESRLGGADANAALVERFLAR